MASAELRLIRRRIGSVSATKKITRAMELIAASRIVKAQDRVRQSIPYADKISEVIRTVSTATGGVSHPLLDRREITKLGVLVIASDRGLAGAYNTNVIRMAEAEMISDRGSGVDNQLFLVGKKSQTYFRFRKYRIERVFEGITDSPLYRDARAIANTLLEYYATGQIDAVDAYYTRYRSALLQEAVKYRILPIEPPAQVEGEEPTAPVNYTFEPSPRDILDRILPRYVEAVVYGMLLDSSASEHASRQRAMKAATDNANELIKVLTRVANQARQAEITTEISEIVGGAEALAEQSTSN